jgi:hypothetical protein
MSQRWFGPKRIGWGIRPTSWQGWAVIGGVVVLCIVIAVAMR